MRSYLNLQQEYIEKAYALSPNSARVNRAKGYVHVARGEMEKAFKSKKRTLEINPNKSLLASRKLMRLLVSSKRYEEAEEYLAKSEKINPDYPGNKFIRGLLYAVEGKREEALQALEDVSYQRYNNIVVYSLLGLKDLALDLVDNKPFETYLDMKHDPFFDILRDNEQFNIALQKAKEEYEENLRKYGEVYYFRTVPLVQAQTLLTNASTIPAVPNGRRDGGVLQTHVAQCCHDIAHGFSQLGMGDLIMPDRILKATEQFLMFFLINRI